MPRRSLPLVALTTLTALAGLAAPVPASTPPARAAGDIDNPATFTFRITDDTGAAIPCRLTFLPAQGDNRHNIRPNLFTNPDADPDRLAVRRNVAYTITGEGSITVPPGDYEVLATRGLEWSIARAFITLRPNHESTWEAALRREIDTTGWVAGDFHLHTLTYSGHGDSNMPERIISIVGEGLEFAVATDHNHNTDYRPTMHQVGATQHLTSIVGNEVSTPVGHFNAFPLDPDRRIIEHRLPSAVPLFKLIREEPNEFGITPVIQLNHPRWANIHYFGQAGLDPITGVPTTDRYSDDFDTIEIFNENENWGYFDPEETDLPVNSGTFSVLRDWFNLLNRGHRYAAVGNSDSHDVESEIAGVPRNYTQSSTDDPAAIDPREVAAALRENRVFTTSGPFVLFSVDNQPMGADATARPTPEGTARVRVAFEVQAASWIDVDRVKIIVNGDVIEEIQVPQDRTRVRINTARSIDLHGDSWVSLLVEGDDSLAPFVHDQGRPILPIAVLNPVWVDADADGHWQSPYARAEQRITEAMGAAALISELEAARPADRALALQAAGVSGRSLATPLIARFLTDDNRYVRLSAARAAEHVADPDLLPAINAATEANRGDTHMTMALLAASIACGADDANDRIIAAITNPDATLLRRFADKFEPLLAGAVVRGWRFAGFFPSESIASVITTPHAPELDPDADTFDTRTGPAAWRTISADSRGFVNFKMIEPNPDISDNAVAYIETWLISPDTREVAYAVGTDDGCVLWINGERVYEDPESHSADPLQHIGRAQLAKGPNRVLLKVANGGGDFGAYFRVLDPDITWTPERP